MLVYGAAIMASVDDARLEPALGTDEPSALIGRNLRLDGRGYLAGGVLRGTMQLEDGFRFGAGVGYYHLGGVGLISDPLPDGIAIGLDGAAMVNGELFVGKAFDGVYFYPYVDLEVSVNVLRAEVIVELADFGDAGTSDYEAISLGLAPRVGTLIPINDAFFGGSSHESPGMAFDIAIEYGVVGVERGGVFAGFGIWDAL